MKLTLIFDRQTNMFTKFEYNVSEEEFQSGNFGCDSEFEKIIFAAGEEYNKWLSQLK